MGRPEIKELIIILLTSCLAVATIYLFWQFLSSLSLSGDQPASVRWLLNVLGD